MDYSINIKNIQGVFNLEIDIEGEDILLIPTPLDKEGVDLLLDTMIDFIEDALWDVTDMSIKPSDEDEPIGIIIDMYRGDEDDDPITTTYWFEDFMDEEPNDDDCTIHYRKLNNDD